MHVDPHRTRPTERTRYKILGEMASNPTRPSDEALLALNHSAMAARLLSGALHEINNALQVISGTAEILEGRSDLSDAVAQSVQRIRTRCTRAADALVDVQLFNKRPEDQLIRIDLGDVLAYCVGVRKFAVRRAGLSIRYEPNSDGLHFVEGTQRLIQQAIVNLLVNAEQALVTSSGVIDVQIQTTGPWVEVRVADDGPGMQLDPRERAFEPFASTRDPSQGAGLGLWAARVIAEAHRGTLTCTADRQRGEEFVLRLPRVE